VRMAILYLLIGTAGEEAPQTAESSGEKDPAKARESTHASD
jgi:hypothetical protein